MIRSKISLFFYPVILVLIFSGISFAQFDDRTLLGSKRLPGINPDSYFSRPVQLVDMPTAGILRSGDIKTSIRLFEQGGALGRLSVGISNKMMFGVSFGGVNVIGRDNVEWNQIPGIHFMYHLTDESLVMPAIVLGFDSQGYGPFYKKVENKDKLDKTETVMSNRYETKSRGFFIGVSKGYTSFIKMGLHGGLSYSLETDDGDKDPTVFLAIDALISRDIALVAEYDFASNDDIARKNNKERGFLNAGIRWAFTDYMFIEFDFKNLFSERIDGQSGINRILKFVYYGSIK
ncbi:hypothetical protein JXQ31_09790 [candidate division KSB1 bacterium]|nr:hypothetical protein [candidate division KSB1 bacterium]